MSTVHTVSDKNPVHVVRADRYRISFSGFLTPQHPDFAAMERYFLPEHRRREGYGLAFLESEEHFVTYAGSIEQIADYRKAQGHRESVDLDCSQGHCYHGWPQGYGWDELTPPGTWHADGRGIVTEFGHCGTKVVVYEYVEDRDGKRVNMVAFHCQRCHVRPDIHFDYATENRGPADRRWIARKARTHIRHAAEECRPADPRISEVVTAVANEMDGGDRPVIADESRCATTGPCSEIRHLRARAATS